MSQIHNHIAASAWWLQWMPQKNAHDKMSFASISIVLYDVLTSLWLSNYSQTCHYVIITPHPSGLWFWDRALGSLPICLRPLGTQEGPMSDFFQDPILPTNVAVIYEPWVLLLRFMRESKEATEPGIPMPENLRDGKDRMIFGNLENILNWHRDFFSE